MDPAIGTDLSLKGIALTALLYFGIPWAKQKLKSFAYDHAVKLAKEAVNLFNNEFRAHGKPGGREAIEKLALDYVKKVCEGQLKKWTDEEWLGTIRHAYEEIRRAEKLAEEAAGRSMKESFLGIAAEMEKLQKTIEEGNKKFEANMAKLRGE